MWNAILPYSYTCMDGRTIIDEAVLSMDTEVVGRDPLGNQFIKGSRQSR